MKNLDIEKLLKLLSKFFGKKPVVLKNIEFGEHNDGQVLITFRVDNTNIQN